MVSKQEYVNLLKQHNYNADTLGGIIVVYVNDIDLIDSTLKKVKELLSDYKGSYGVSYKREEK